MRPLLSFMLLCSLSREVAIAESRSIDALRPCQSSTAGIPKGWSTFQAPETKLRFSLPPGARPIPQPEAFCIHGCEQWTRDSLTITATHGIWSPESFTDEDWRSACVSRRGQLRVVTMTPDANTILLWPSDDASTTLSTANFILSVKVTDERDRKDAIVVINSLRLK